MLFYWYYLERAGIVRVLLRWLLSYLGLIFYTTRGKQVKGKTIYFWSLHLPGIWKWFSPQYHFFNNTKILPEREITWKIFIVSFDKMNTLWYVFVGFIVSSLSASNWNNEYKFPLASGKYGADIRHIFCVWQVCWQSPLWAPQTTEQLSGNIFL